MTSILTRRSCEEHQTDHVIIEAEVGMTQPQTREGFVSGMAGHLQKLGTGKEGIFPGAPEENGVQGIP